MALFFHILKIIVSMGTNHDILDMWEKTMQNK